MNTTKLAYLVLDYVVSEKLYSYFEVSLNLWTMLFLSCLGVVTNTLNAVVFVRQGFRDSVNITMMAITCWDMVKCTTGLIHRMYGPLHAISPLVSYLWQTLTFHVDYTPIFAGYVNYSLTAYLSVERCLCVSKPFTVKSIITRKVTLIVVLTISCVVYGAFFVVYFLYDIQYVYDLHYNETFPVFFYSTFYSNTQRYIMPYYNTIAIVLPSVSFLILCICSSLTLYYLRKSSEFTKNNRRSAHKVSYREIKVSKMLLAVIAVKIGNLFPRIVSYVFQLIEPEYYVLKKYHYLFMTVTRFLYLLDFINAGVIFFIYISMSSNFKTTFSQLFCKR